MRSCLFASLLAGMLLCWLMPGPAAAEGLLELSRDVPPRKLADAAEVIVVSGYKPDMEDQMGAVARVTVTVDRPGARVLLVLTSCKVVHWQGRPRKAQRLRAFSSRAMKRRSFPPMSTSRPSVSTCPA